MNNLKFLLVIVATSGLVSACAMWHKETIVPSTSLEKDNYQYVRDVKAKISYTYILGIGGLVERSVTDKLRQEANLMPGEALVNVGVHTRMKSYLLLVIVKDFIATGQVVRFIDGPHHADGISQDQIQYEKLQNRLAGYDGDFLNAMPVGKISAFISSSADLQLGKYGVTFKPETAVDAFNATNNLCIEKTGLQTQNEMLIKIMKCDNDGAIQGFVEITDKDGNLVSTAKFNGLSKRGKTPDDLFEKSIQDAATKLYLNWYLLKRNTEKLEKQKAEKGQKEAKTNEPKTKVKETNKAEEPKAEVKEVKQTKENKAKVKESEKPKSEEKKADTKKKESKKTNPSHEELDRY